MNTKLTLTLDKTVIEQAKVFATEQGRSLSAIVENYLKLVSTKNDKKEQIELSPIVKSILNDFPKIELPDDYDYKKELEKAREEKYQKYLNNG